MDWFKMGTSQHCHNFVRNVIVVVIDDVRLLNASSSPTAPNVPLVSIDMHFCRDLQLQHAPNLLTSRRPLSRLSNQLGIHRVYLVFGTMPVSREDNMLPYFRLKSFLSTIAVVDVAFGASEHKYSTHTKSPSLTS